MALNQKFQMELYLVESLIFGQIAAYTNRTWMKTLGL